MPTEVQIDSALAANGHLTLSFTFDELVVTAHRSLIDQNRQEALAFLPALHATARLLQEVRWHFGKPVLVHSGFRCPELNAAVGGSSSSQHMKGEAADFHVARENLRDVWHWIVHESDLAFGQCLLEGSAKAPSWIHLSLGPPWRSAARSGDALTWSPEYGYSRLPSVSLEGRRSP